MTAIIAFAPGGFPALIGDLLLSSRLPHGNPVNIPTIGDVRSIVSNSIHITGTKQKVCLIGENIVIGWAGNMIAARVVINQLLDLNKRSDMSLDDVTEFFRYHLDDWTRQQELSILGHVAHSNSAGTFGYNCHDFQSQLFGDTRLAGSGKDGILHVLNQFDHIPTPTNEATINPLEKAIVCSLGVVGALIGEELTTRSNLADFYGGGYEICSLVRNKFRKINDIVYLWWILRYRGDRYGLSTPRKVMKVDYQNDILVIRALDFDQSTSKRASSTILKDAVYLIPPVYRSIKNTEVSQLQLPLELPSRFVCNIITYLNGKNEIQYLNLIYYAHDKKGPIRFSSTDDKVVIHYHNEFLEAIGNSIKNKQLS